MNRSVRKARGKANVVDLRGLTLCLPLCKGGMRGILTIFRKISPIPSLEKRGVKMLNSMILRRDV
jgi:hypothetical protein